MQIQRILTEKKASPLVLLAMMGLMLSTLLSAYYPSWANAQQGPATANGNNATLSFELAVEGEPPADAKFFGAIPAEGCMSVQLTDPDGDGVYTGSTNVPKFAPGGPPEPVSLPVQIVQADSGTGPCNPTRVIKDFGQVKMDGDKTFSANVSFDDNGDGSEVNVQGTITSISGSTVLVEETPAAEGSGDKGYFTVTDETELTKQEEGEQVAAAFGDLEVGQIVEAVYAGPAAQSYPTQGNAESIAILEELTCKLPEGCDDPADADKATLYFELEVEGEPPAQAEFLGLTATESLMTTPLTDPDGDGTYTGSKTMNKFAPGGPPEPISISPVQIVQGPPTGYTANGPQYRVIKDFGQVKLDGDKTLSASVSFDDEEPAPEEVSATGRIGEIADYPGASYAITDEVSGVRYFLTSDSVDLQDYAVSGERVIVYGTPVPNQSTPDTLLNVTRVEPAGTPPSDDGGSDNGDSNNGGSNNGGSDNSGSGSSGGSDNGGSGSSDSGSNSGSSGGVVASGIRGLLPSTGGGMALTLLGAGVLMTGGGLIIRRIFR